MRSDACQELRARRCLLGVKVSRSCCQSLTSPRVDSARVGSPAFQKEMVAIRDSHPPGSQTCLLERKAAGLLQICCGNEVFEAEMVACKTSARRHLWASAITGLAQCSATCAAGLHALLPTCETDHPGFSFGWAPWKCSTSPFRDTSMQVEIRNVWGQAHGSTPSLHGFGVPSRVLKVLAA